MSFLRYETYKDSGHDWLGSIPEHWKVAKFRHYFVESSEKIDGEVEGVMLSVSGYRGIEIKQYEDENQRRSEDNLVGYRLFASAS
jgi:type I restriction enzyme S subunit